ncbi:hypothetical protein BGZ61DRAFT_523344 [Ilyonectria robusta]|uniref:uncharacterized protein n=1 Tax=Ilyonectria robusta TaxID=1079257 RepID=UPI001E8CE016|nr:uncharacterized protein BGZ61DRAFT_523344 [Ilyonectria robusta]KAH8661004.1 hypothetical protein BGZ61DRAFT_523344 [Ilyonectria robusta]
MISLTLKWWEIECSARLSAVLSFGAHFSSWFGALTERRSTCRLSKLAQRLGQMEEQQKSPPQSESEKPSTVYCPPSSPTPICPILAVVSYSKPSTVRHSQRGGRPMDPWSVSELSFFRGILEVLILPVQSHPIAIPTTDPATGPTRASSTHATLTAP